MTVHHAVIENADQFDWTWIQFQLLKRPVKSSLVKKK